VIACPDCPPVRAARALARDELVTNLLLAALPFVIVLGLVAWIVSRVDRKES
jgi:hypothetical protein